MNKINLDQVIQYKIYLCVAGYEPEIRRIAIDNDICCNYFYLKQRLLAIFPTLKDVAFTISWKDHEGDNIRICTDDELAIALKDMAAFDFKKLYVNATPQGKEGPVHSDVVCDGCEQQVRGFRYKCIVCYDYDLCPDCERSQVHPDHPMIRIPIPLSREMPFGKRFDRDLSKMTKHLERLFQMSSEQCSDKKAKGDYASGYRSGRSSDRKKPSRKFCTSSDLHNMVQGLLFDRLSHMNNPCPSGDSAAANDETQERKGSDFEQQASSSTVNNLAPIFEEQKNFVSLLTSGLNSFLDPLGADVVVEDPPVHDTARNHPEPSQSSASDNEATAPSTEACPKVNSASKPQPEENTTVQDQTVTVSAPPSSPPKQETSPLDMLNSPPRFPYDYAAETTSDNVAFPRNESYEGSILDGSWTVINRAENNIRAALGFNREIINGTSQPLVQIEPQPVLPSSPPIEYSVEETMKRLIELGFEDEPWLLEIVNLKKGDIREVLRFLTPIRLPMKPSTNMIPPII